MRHLLLLAIVALSIGCKSEPSEALLPENEAIKSAPVRKARPAYTSEEPREPSRKKAAPEPARPATVTTPEPSWFEDEDVGTIDIIREEDPIKQRYLEALELLEIDKNTEAIALLVENVKDAPKDPVNHWNLASVYLATEQGAAALPSLRKAVELDPKNVEYALTLAGVDLLLGNTEAAEALLGKLVKAHPEIADVHYQLGLLHLAAGRTTEALAAMKEAVARDATHAQAWTRLAILYVEAERWPEALAAVLKIQAAGEPEAAESVEFLHGQILGKMRRCEEAAKILGRAREQGQADMADLSEGECWLGKGDLDKALPPLLAVTTRTPDCHPCQLFLGDALFMKQDWEAALKAYESAAAIEPMDDKSRRQAGKCLLNLQRAGDAVSFLEDATKLAVEDPEAWELLGHAYVAAANKAEAWTVMERLEKLGAPERAKTIRQLLTN